jgi:hypothetical protein
MRRRRSQHPTISLFSFQDIVTSVTAILILIVLILSLELISRKFEQTARDGAATEASLRTVLTDLEKTVDRLRADVVAPRSLMQGRADMPTDRDLQILRDQLDRSRLQMADAQRVNSEARRHAIAAEARLAEQRASTVAAREDEQRAEDLEAETRCQTARNDEDEAQQDVRKRDIAERTSSGAELVFKRPADEKRQPWLVEVSDEGLCVLRLGAGEVDQFESGVDDGSKALAWLNTLVPARDYVLMLVRPSGVEAALAVRAAIEAADIPFGMDFIGEGQVVRDGAAGKDHPE